jgi:non-specific serine/threonine protein kinase/serine/threonine-protein kinase
MTGASTDVAPARPNPCPDRTTVDVERTMAMPPEDDDPVAPGTEPVDQTMAMPADGSDAAAVRQPADAAPERVGPYRLIEPIGVGGMGEVYLAEQEEPIRRKVALKIVKHGMDTREFVARFESERQALAMMDHPCIAKVFDAGASERGRPYFVMEFVEGVPVTEYCDDHRLDLKARLELFVRICEGVQHAHQKAIIHRDIKPSNVLVAEQDGTPVPKIIDFGVAKAMDDTLTDHTMQTNVGQLLGTPAYMSPEQADMDSQGIDTRTDVYALGVLLYELLVGERPFTQEEFENVGLAEALRKIREDDPPRPSARVTTLSATLEETAHARSLAPTSLRKRLRGDLDWIVMKALEKDRARRYETANGLALDIRRHLDDQPVLAGPPSTAYLARKFVKRHRNGVLAGLFVMIAVMLGIAGTTVGLIRAVNAERQATLEAATATQVSDFLVDLFEVSDPDRARGSTITAREILDTGAARLEEELAGQPRTQARLMQTIGKVYRNLGLFEEAEPLLQTALDLRRQQGDGDDLMLAASLIELADLHIKLARYEVAEGLLREAMDLMDRHADADRLALAQSLGELASVYRRQGRYDEARPLYERARDLRIEALGPDDPLVATSYNGLAILAWNEGDYDAAESLYLQALAIWEAAYGEDHADVAKGLNNLGLLYHQIERFEEAEVNYQRAIAIYERILGPDHPRLGRAVNNLALLYHFLERYDEAAPLYERALAVREQAVGRDHPDVAQTVNNLANLYRARGDYDRAEPLYRRALAIREDTFGPDHQDVAWTKRDLGVLISKRGDPLESLPYFEAALDIFHEAHGLDHPELETIYEDYAEALERAGFTDRAALAAAEAARIKALHD